MNLATARSWVEGELDSAAAAFTAVADVVKRPHVLGVETQMRLGSQRLAVGTDEAEVLDRIGNVPAVIAVLPLAATAEAAHRRGRTALILGAEGHLVRPAASFRAIGVHLAVHFVAAEVLADEARHHAAPAAVRVDISDVAVEQA